MRVWTCGHWALIAGQSANWYSLRYVYTRNPLGVGVGFGPIGISIVRCVIEKEEKA